MPSEDSYASAGSSRSGVSEARRSCKPVASNTALIKAAATSAAAGARCDYCGSVRAMVAHEVIASFAIISGMGGRGDDVSSS